MRTYWKKVGLPDISAFPGRSFRRWRPTMPPYPKCWLWLI